MINKVKKHIGFHYLLAKIQLCTLIKDTSITHNAFRLQLDDSITCGFYCIAFIEYMIAGNTLLDYTNLFSPNDYKKMVQ